MMLDTIFPVSASEPSTSAEVVAGHFVLATTAVPDAVAAVAHRDAGPVQTSELIRPTSNLKNNHYVILIDSK
jgi:hypothetical protein